MDIQEAKKEFKKYGSLKKGAEVYYREDWNCEYFSLIGKCFGLMSDEMITLKGDPEKNEILRYNYKDVIPGYYTNKKHWNTIYLYTEELTIEEIKGFIDESYELVYKKLTKKDKLKIESME